MQNVGVGTCLGADGKSDGLGSLKKGIRKYKSYRTLSFLQLGLECTV